MIDGIWWRVYVTVEFLLHCDRRYIHPHVLTPWVAYCKLFVCVQKSTVQAGYMRCLGVLLLGALQAWRLKMSIFYYNISWLLFWCVNVYVIVHWRACTEIDYSIKFYCVCISCATRTFTGAAQRTYELACAWLKARPQCSVAGVTECATSVWRFWRDWDVIKFFLTVISQITFLAAASLRWRLNCVSGRLHYAII